MRPVMAACACAVVLAPAAAGAAESGPMDPFHLEASAAAETSPVFEADGADADDPAVWVHPEDSSRSVVYGTAKEGGLYAYGLDGSELQHLPAGEGGRYNNVAVVTGFELDDREVDLAVASDRGRDTVAVWEIDRETGLLTDVSAPGLDWVFSDSAEEVAERHTAYGLTAWSDDGDAYVLVTQADETAVALLELDDEDGRVSYEHEAELSLPDEFTLPDGTEWSPCTDPGEYAHAEGLAVDESGETAYIAQEAVGIWEVPADLDEEPELLDTVAEFGVPAEYDPVEDDCVAGEDPGFGGEHLSADVEGLAVAGDELFASSQGNDVFAVYGLDSGEFERSFAIVDGEAADGAQHTDGLTVAAGPVGPFREGLLVVQDGDNTPEGTDESSTNFKFVPLQKVLG